MPYSIKKEKDKFIVIVTSSGKRVGSHDTEKKAKRQIQAININEHKKGK